MRTTLRGLTELSDPRSAASRTVGLISTRRRTVGYQLVCVAALSMIQQSAAAGQVLTPVQTQSTSPPGVLVETNWGAGTGGITNPLTFSQFNPSLGTLNAVDLTLTVNIRNDYILTFVNTPIETTIYVATTNTTDPSILADPAKRALLTDGPTVTLFGPGGSSQLFGVPATEQPVDLVELTKPSGTFSSLLPITNPNFIPPTITQQSYSRTLDLANAPSLVSDFIGKGAVDLPVTATAFSSFFSDTGNGGGTVLTKAEAIVTVQYLFTPAVVSHTIPEPSSAVLLGLGAGIGLLAARWRRRAA